MVVVSRRVRARSRISTGIVLLASLAVIGSSDGAAAPGPHPGMPPGHGSRAAGDGSSPAGVEMVTNGSARETTDGWRAGSAAGAVVVTRVAQLTGRFAGSSGIRISRRGGAGAWAMATSALREPETSFAVGRTYRMQAWVRDTSASGASIGMLLANGNYAHRPTAVTATVGGTDGTWHLLSRTFVCTAAAHPDTSLYFALPSSGRIDVQITGASVREVAAGLPATVAGAASTTLTFGGAAGSRPDPAHWNHETGGNGWGHGELQSYTADVANAHLDGAGRLRLIARHQRHRGTDGVTRDFTSARLTTAGKVTVAPGSYVETSIVAPTGEGAWPAFWLVGANIATVGWPACGELDVLEGWGTRPSIAHSAVHMSALGDPQAHRQFGWGEAGGSTDLGRPLDAGPHRYGVYFDREVVRFYIDRRPTMTIWADDAAAAGHSWPFGAAQFIVLNVAVPSDTDPSRARYPKVMTVGTIVVWQGGVPFP